MFADDKIKDFLEAVAAKRPTPGGGSVSAIVGALGSALGIMTARYSEDADSERALDVLKNEFAALADADAEAYGLVTSAMSLPKDSEETKRRRKTALQSAFADAAEVPLKGMTMAVKALDVLSLLAGRCNKHLVSDLASACGFVWAALEGCAENVRVNAASLHDAEKRLRLDSERARLLAAGAELRNGILKAVEASYASK